MIGRAIVVELWSGATVVCRLAPGDPNPTQAELDALATAFTARNDGVRPVVRLLEETRIPRPFGVGGAGGPAGGVTP